MVGVTGYSVNGIGIYKLVADERCAVGFKLRLRIAVGIKAYFTAVKLVGDFLKIILVIREEGYNLFNEGKKLCLFASSKGGSISLYAVLANIVIPLLFLLLFKPVLFVQCFNFFHRVL